jgi:hypothetical protein
MECVATRSEIRLQIEAHGAQTLVHVFAELGAVLEPFIVDHTLLVHAIRIGVRKRPLLERIVLVAIECRPVDRHAIVGNVLVRARRRDVVLRRVREAHLLPRGVSGCRHVRRVRVRRGTVTLAAVAIDALVVERAFIAEYTIPHR